MQKCGSTEYEIKDKPNGTGIAHGLYCAKCGFWHKWLGKEELRQYEKKDSKDEIIARLQAENAALRERLEKAVEFPRIRKSANYARTGKYVVEFIREDDGGVDLDIDLTKEEAESCLAELKGE